MANVVSKLVDEIKWGAMLGVMQGDYNRCFQLYNMLGGIYAVMRGADGIMSGVIVEMLRDLDEK